ncbi:uncharacterized protein BDR25DRAFT_312707 [Lindgomyces ingoldianus]|uniref:Uncharacterized protein n=1 Tax=Lindgomyces ingoldianus TaxID=673940 RepID=A0ACB6R1Z5_9PLEO|nr:uncharacterized protein BDR25DRAFT_312707 [Lindgomyces ingoldianus]KAF2472810.1 hypothetical protein BDR25DRAFT_312707 [Lindgomyces ingoldianus]
MSKAELTGPPEGAPQFTIEAVSEYPGLRPALAHRLYSHRLHVRAKAKLQRDRLLSGPLVDIYVGKSRRHWALHLNLLCHHSEYLESELQSDGEKKQDKLELMDYDPAGFELLVKWMYQGKLDDVSDMVDPNQKYEYAVRCHKLYLLCDRFDMPQLKNVAMDQYRKGLNEAQLVPDAEEIDDIYRKSPVGSPFRRLMTKIAARQIMDPESERDVETYRECFVDNSDFAVDLVNAVKLGTGGMLFEDPTYGNGCEYHDHEAGPNCHIKGKGRVKQALKASALRPSPKSVKSDPTADHGPPLLHRLPPPTTPTPQPPPQNHPQSHPRQARRQDGISAGPLRRRLTSPASSTIEMSKETATASPPSPKEQRDKFRWVAPLPPETHQENPAAEEESPAPQTAPDEHHQSSDGGSHPPLDSSASDSSNKSSDAKQILGDTSPRRGLWEWARAGTGRLGLSRIPHPEWRGPLTSKAATTAVNGALDGGRKIEETQDDFSVPSATSTEPGNETRKEGEEAAAARVKGLGTVNSTVDPMFSQTKRSSDDLVADASATPSPNMVRPDRSPKSDEQEQSLPLTPSPPERKRVSTDESESTGLSSKKEVDEASNTTPSPHRIPMYKIALASNILSPSRKTTVS